MAELRESLDEFWIRTELIDAVARMIADGENIEADVTDGILKFTDASWAAFQDALNELRIQAFDTETVLWRDLEPYFRAFEDAMAGLELGQHQAGPRLHCAGRLPVPLHTPRAQQGSTLG